MKNVKMIFGTMLMFLLAGASTSCSDDPTYDAASPETTAQVYISNETLTKYTVSADLTAVSLDVRRANTNGALSIPVTITAGQPEAASAFTGASSVSFADGVDQAAYELGINADQLEPGSTYTVSVELGDASATTIYGLSKIELTFVVPEPLVLLGTGLFREDCITSIFSVDVVEYECEIYENLNRPGYIFLKNVYTDLYPFNDPVDIVAEGDKYFEINIADPDKVIIPRQYLGIDWGPGEYGEFLVGTTEYGTLKDGVITFPPSGLLIGMKIYTDDGFGWYANTNGMFRVVMPGVVLGDYSVEVNYAGIFHSSSDEYFAVAEVSGGEDVERVEVAMAPGKNNGDALIEAMQAGTVEIFTIKGAAGTVQLPLGADGDYTIAAISYGGGEAKETAAVSFKFYAGTAPEVDPLEEDYTFDDIYEIEKEDLFKEWMMYGNWFNRYDDERVGLAYVNFAESDMTDEYESDLIEVSGLTKGLIEDDTVLWEYYEGFVLNIDNGIFEVEPGEEYLGFLNFSSTGGKLYGGDWGIIGGLVADGYMAFVDNETGVNIDGYGLYAYADPDGENALGGYAFFYNLMMVDPALKVAAAAKSNITTKDLKNLAVSLSTRTNFVESNRGYMRSQIDKLRAAKKTGTLKADQATASYRGTVGGSMREVKAATREMIAPAARLQ